jgi:protease II
MKNWIKKKLISFLGIDLLERDMKQENNKLKSELNKLKSLNEKIIEENNFLIKQFNISADINHYENHSWAVISIQGKPEYVKFINLSDQDMRSIHMFLKQFERTNRTIDSPFPFLKY